MSNDTEELIKNLSTKELENLLEDYCNPHAWLKSRKKFGFSLDRALIKRTIIDQTIEDILLPTSPTDTE